MLNSMPTAIQGIATASFGSVRPYNISDRIKENWAGGNEKGECRDFMSDLHLCM